MASDAGDDADRALDDDDASGRGTDADRDGTGAGANAAPDAVKDPNAKTDGKPGLPGGGQGGETDPGGG